MKNGKKKKVVSPWTEIGKHARALRMKAGLTQGALAGALGYVSPQIVSNWERGLAGIPVDTLGPFCEVVGCNGHELIDFMVNEYRKQLTEAYNAHRRKR